MFSLHPSSRCYPLHSVGKDVILRQNRKFLNQLSDYNFLHNYFVPYSYFNLQTEFTISESALSIRYVPISVFGQEVGNTYSDS
jgi:hypothetical protein